MSSPRTLTEAVRAFDHDQLTELLRLRPDLSYPLPRQLAELVGQATTSASTARAIDGLNGWQRAVAEALAVAPDGACLNDVTALLGEPSAVIVPAVEALRCRALLWGDDHDLHLVRSVRDHFGSYPAGLAPISPHPLTEQQISDALAACGDQARPVLDRLLWGPPTGTVRNADRPISVAEARSPVEQLLAHRLLRPLDRDTVILVREVALRLRAVESDWLLDHDRIAPEPPTLSGPKRSGRVITSAAIGAANELVHDAELIIAELDAAPRRLLRDGGLSARDVTALSRHLDGRTDYTAFLIESVAAAGLIGTGDRITLLPTTEYDRWLTLPGPTRWLRLALAWRDAERYFSATADSHPLSQDGVTAPRAPDHRKLILTICAGAEVSTMLDPVELTEVIGWHRPALKRSAERLTTVIDWTLQEAGWLGLTALGAVSDLLPVIAGDGDLDDDLGRLFPEPLDQVIVQSDLTAVAQGPLESGVAGTLRLLADQESRGGGAVYRFHQSSIRRAFDAGWAAVDVSSWLERHSATGIPQPLRYLIDDVARQHGTIRVGSAASYVRIEDPAQQAAVLAHPNAVRLRLRAIAPGVLVSPADPDEVVTVLQDLGLKPAAEDELGQLLTTQPRRRAPARNVTADRRRTPSPSDAAAAILAAELRLPPVGDDVTLLTEAIRAKARVRIDYVGPSGEPAARDLDPVEVGDGSVRGVDPRTAELIVIPIARISAVTSSEKRT